MTTAEWLANMLQEDKENPKLDWKRAEGMDPRDKRAVGEPCRGSHTVDKNGRIKNAHMVMYRCTAKDCGIRLLYVPSVGSVGTSFGYCQPLGSPPHRHRFSPGWPK